MSDKEVTDKHGNIIHRGDYVVTKIRGGTHEGHVSKGEHLMNNHWLDIYEASGQIALTTPHIYRWMRSSQTSNERKKLT